MRTILRLLFLSASALAASPALAAMLLSQRIVELRAVLDQPEVVAFLSGAPFNRIDYVEPGFYRVSAGRCRMDVAIVRPPLAARTGDPMRFEVRPAGRTCGR